MANNFIPAGWGRKTIFSSAFSAFAGELRAPQFKLTLQAHEGEIAGVHPAGHDCRVPRLRVLQNIGNMDDAGEAEFTGPALTREMVVGHGFHQRNGQTPQRQQISANFRVSGLKIFSLHFKQGGKRFAGFLHYRGILHRQSVGQNDFSDVVQHPRAKRLFGQKRVVETLGENSLRKVKSGTVMASD